MKCNKTEAQCKFPHYCSMNSRCFLTVGDTPTNVGTNPKSDHRWQKMVGTEADTYERWVLVDQLGEIHAEIRGLWPLGMFEYKGRRFVDRESAKRAAERDCGR